MRALWILLFQIPSRPSHWLGLLRFLLMISLSYVFLYDNSTGCGKAMAGSLQPYVSKNLCESTCALLSFAFGMNAVISALVLFGLNTNYKRLHQRTHNSSKAILLILVFISAGCSTSVREEESEPIQYTNPPENEQPFANPVLIYGSSFLDFFSALKICSPNNLDTLLVFTSRKSIEKHGREKILSLYGRTNLNFQKELRAMSRVNDTTFVLNYSCYLFATSGMRTVTVTVESDTCRLLLPDNLNEFLKER